MLRFPQSRISLFPSDIIEYERIRGVGRFHYPPVHLAPGPGRLTSLGIVPIEDDTVYTTAACCSSEATLHRDLDDAVGRLRLSAPVASCLSNPVPDTSPVLEAVENKRCGQLPYRQPIQSEANELVESDPCIQLSQSGKYTSVSNDDLKSHTTSDINRRLLDCHLSDSSAVLTVVRPCIGPDCEAANASFTPSLDPSAPLFVPRAISEVSVNAVGEERTVLAKRGQLSPKDHRSMANLCLRSYPASNLHRHASGSRQSSSSAEERLVNGSIPDKADSVRHMPRFQPHARDGVSDQSRTLPKPTPNLDRYPLLVPPSKLPTSRNFSRSNEAIIPRRRSSLQHLVESSTKSSPLSSRKSRSSGSRLDSCFGGDSGLLSPAPRSLCTATPNLVAPKAHLPQHHLRSSSLTCNYIFNQQSTHSRHPGPTKIVGGSVELPQKQELSQSPGATTRFLHIRDSPLDELTQRLTWIRAGRPVFEGRLAAIFPEIENEIVRPIDNSRKNKILTLSPAKGEATGAGYDDDKHCPNRLLGSISPTTKASDQSFDVDSSPGIIPISNFASMTPLDESRQHQSRSPSEKPMSKRTPTPLSVNDTYSAQNTKTPRFRIYDERKPPQTQPQTPAEIRVFRRRDGDADLSPVVHAPRDPIFTPQAHDIRHGHPFQHSARPFSRDTGLGRPEGG